MPGLGEQSTDEQTVVSTALRARNERVLVTGVDGFTGRHLAPLLSASGYEVHGLAAQMPLVPVGGVANLVCGDLRDTRRLHALVEDITPQVVVHLGGVSFVHGDAEPMYAVNLLGTRNLLTALAGMAHRPRLVALASSANIYGNATEGILDEATAPHPANDYAVSKLAMEHMAALFIDRLPIVICRPFNYTGVGQSERFLIPKIVAHAKRRATSLELGNLDVVRDFSDVRDVASVYASLIQIPRLATPLTLNVCSGMGHSLSDVLAMVEVLSKWSMEVVVNPDLVRANEVRVLCGSRRRLETLLPALPRPIPLSDTLRWMIEER